MHTGAELTGNVVVAYLVTEAVQWAKQSRWVPWLTAERANLARWISMALAAVASLGIHSTFDASVAGGQLVVTGLGWAALRGHAWDWLTQFVSQQFVYKGIVKPNVKLDVGVVEQSAKVVA